MSQEILNDIELLKIMMRDMGAASSLYKPTNWWEYHQNINIPELENKGLANIFNDPNHRIIGFIGDRLRPKIATYNLNGVRLLSNKFTRRVPGWEKLLSVFSKCLTQACNYIPHTAPYRMNADDILLLIYYFTKQIGQERNAKPLEAVQRSRIGNPVDTFEVDGRLYNFKILQSYMYYSYANQFVDFDNIETVVELGSGWGSQAEVWMQLNPDVRLFLFDISPTLYVAEQYLRSVFGNRVISYREMREAKSLSELPGGKIYMLGSWQFELLKELKFDLFWSTRSLSEMEPDVIENYLTIASAGADAVYLCQTTGGARLALRKNQPGVKERVVWSDYERILEKNFNKIAEDPYFSPSQPSLRAAQGHDRYFQFVKEAVWKRRDA